MIPSKSSGFTLLETMIAVAIMASMTLLVAQAMRSAVENQRGVTTEITRDAQLADTLRIIRSDLAAAFHYQDVFCKMAKEAASPAAPAAAANAGQPAPGTEAAPAGTVAGLAADPNATACPDNNTGFIGTADSMYFTSLANVRVMKDSQQSDQAKIGYFLKSCRVLGAKTENASNCLYRSTSPRLDDKLDEPGTETMLLENVEEFKLKYLGPQKEELAEAWRTWKDGTDQVAKENFPYAVEITLTTLNKNDPKDKLVTQTILAPIHFENNPVAKKPKQNVKPQ